MALTVLDYATYCALAIQLSNEASTKQEATLMKKGYDVAWMKGVTLMTKEQQISISVSCERFVEMVRTMVELKK